MAKRSIVGLRGILTGASSGIGRALADQLVRGGAQLVVVARRDERLGQLATSLTGAAGRVETLAGDITDPAVRQAALNRATSAFGGLDLLINNAGAGALGRFADASPDRLRKIMELNFFAPAELIRAAVPLLRAANKPIVVNVSSVLGHRAVPRHSEYCASKFALQGLSESLRAELSKLGIDLLVVSPGTTETEFFDSSIDAGETPWPKTRAMPAAVVARKTVAAIQAGKHEIVLGNGKLLALLNRLSPRLLDRAMARYG